MLITNECFHNNQINSINQHNNYNNKGLYIIIIEKAIHKHTEGNECAGAGTVMIVEPSQSSYVRMYGTEVDSVVGWAVQVLNRYRRRSPQ